MTWSALASLALLLAAAPALPGVATRTRAWLTGRRGAPVLQLYYELAKLLRKRAVYSGATTALFRLAPLAGAVGVVCAAALLPLDARAAPAAFAGDFVLFGGLLALGRFLFVLAALDTGSSFEGMGASREAMVGAFAESGVFLGFAALALATGALTLSAMLGPPLAAASVPALAPLVMVALCFFILLLAEAARVPVDDPATHLELTMIHEVAVLDHSGPDLALVLYGSAVRFAVFAALVGRVLVPRAWPAPPASLAVLAATLVVVAVAVGVVEAVMARLKLGRIPQLLVAASALAAFACILLLRRP